MAGFSCVIVPTELSPPGILLTYQKRLFLKFCFLLILFLVLTLNLIVFSVLTLMERGAIFIDFAIEIFKNPVRKTSKEIIAGNEIFFFIFFLVKIKSFIILILLFVNLYFFPKKKPVSGFARNRPFYIMGLFGNPAILIAQDPLALRPLLTQGLPFLRLFVFRFYTLKHFNKSSVF